MLLVDLDQAAYQPVWRCIYCGWDERPEELTKEHILPFALGGKAVLPKSSCRACAKATGDFERIIARNIFGPLRLVYGYPTRKPEERPATLPLDVTIEGKTERRDIQIDDYPAVPISVLSWGPPGILIGRSPSPEFHDLTPQIIMPPVKEQAAKLERLGVAQGATLTMPLSFDALAFSKQVAKIAHVMAVADFGVDSFRPYLTDLIRGRDERAAYLVGKSGGPFEKGPPLSNKQDHEGQIGLFESPKRTLITARIRMFGFLGLPTYVAVVGEPGPELVRRLKDAARHIPE